MIISNFIFHFTIFCVLVSFSTKLLTLGILYSTAVKAVVVAKLVILGISPLTSFILALIEALVATLVISGVLSSHYIHLFYRHQFLLHHLVYLNRQEELLIYQ